GGGVDTDRGRIDADKVIVAAGSRVGALLPRLAEALVPVRQTLVYADVDADPATFPLWVWKGRAAGEMFYGLPQFQRPGIKVARHVLDGPRADPDGTPDAADAEPTLAFLRERLSDPVRAAL